MLLNGRPKRMLLESEILAAQSISKTEADVARKLGVSFMTYRKYAKMYNLYGRVSNMAGKGVSKPIKNEDSGKYPLNHILENKFPKYSTTRLKTRLIRSNRIERKCNKCNFNERRILDNNVYADIQILAIIIMCEILAKVYHQSLCLCFCHSYEYPFLSSDKS